MLNVWERKILGKIYGPLKKGNKWRIRTNDEIGNLYQEPTIVALDGQGTWKECMIIGWLRKHTNKSQKDSVKLEDRKRGGLMVSKTTLDNWE